ncbi:hypothetical protein LJC46_01160 [Desulfovibrio sp. OttesenSCG-928-G15]|nr:hypothetical protein [Desulfovibrio sp. OttesenSCG-928-G15]
MLSTYATRLSLCTLCALLFMVCAWGCVPKKKPGPEPVEEAPVVQLPVVSGASTRILTAYWHGEITLPLADTDSPLKNAKDVPLRLLAVQEKPGRQLLVTAVVEGNGSSATAPGLLRAAMALAMANQARTAAEGAPDVQITVEVLPEYFAPSPYTVLLARVTLVPGVGGQESRVFPGPAWPVAEAAARGLTDKELRYLDMAQRLTPVRNALEVPRKDLQTELDPQTAAKALHMAGLSEADLDLEKTRVKSWY